MKYGGPRFRIEICDMMKLYLIEFLHQLSTELYRQPSVYQSENNWLVQL